MANTSNETIWTKNFIVIFFINFFIFFVFYALLTTLPLFVIDDLNRSKTEAGLVITAFLISAIVIRPFSAKLLEDYGKTRMLFASVAFYLLANFMYIFVDNYYALLILRLFQGVWFSIATTATSSLAIDAIPAARRGEGMGYYTMSLNVAMVIGPFVALTLIQYFTFPELFFGLGVVMFLGALMVFVIKAEPFARKEGRRRLTWSDLFEKRSVPVSLIGSLISFTYASILSFISTYAKELNLIEVASFFFVVFAVSMLISRPFVGRLYDIKGPNIVVYPAFVLFSLGLFLLSVTDSPLMLLTSGAIIGLGYGSLVPCFQTLAVQAADSKRGGHAVSTFFTFFDIGIAAGSYILGIVSSVFGYSELYLFSSLFVLFIILLYRLLPPR